MGERVSAARTADQTESALFWAGTALTFWNRAAVAAALARHTTLSENARTLRAVERRDRGRRHRVLGLKVLLRAVAADYGDSLASGNDDRAPTVGLYRIEESFAGPAALDIKRTFVLLLRYAQR